MTRKNSVALAVLFFVVTSLSFQPVSAQRGGDRCEFSADITAELAATSEELIRIEAGSGSLTVEGQAGLSAVRVTVIACASDEWMLEELRVSLERRRMRSITQLGAASPRSVAIASSIASCVPVIRSRCCGRSRPTGTSWNSIPAGKRVLNSDSSRPLSTEFSVTRSLASNKRWA